MFDPIGPDGTQASEGNIFNYIARICIGIHLNTVKNQELLVRLHQPGWNIRRIIEYIIVLVIRREGKRNIEYGALFHSGFGLFNIWT
jgi:hypothetical protein